MDIFRKIRYVFLASVSLALLSCARETQPVASSSDEIRFGARFGETVIGEWTKAAELTSLGDFYVSASTGAAGAESSAWVSERFKELDPAVWSNGRVWPHDDPSWHFYASSAVMSHSADGALVSVDSSEDVVVAKLMSPAFGETNTFVFDHILTRLGVVNVSPAGSGYTVSDVNVSFTPMTVGVYNIRTGEWKDMYPTDPVSVANPSAGSKTNDIYFIPGKYTLSISWKVTDAEGTRSYSNSREVDFEPGLKARLDIQLMGKEPGFVCLAALEDCVFSLTAPSTGAMSIAYSLDKGVTWVSMDVTSGGTLSTPVVPVGTKVYWKGMTSGQCHFGSTGQFTVTGNPLSIVYGDAFESVSTLTVNNIFDGLFSGSPVANASGLVLSASSLSAGAYREMFKDCIFLTVPPRLPATGLSDGCYRSMFKGCTSLTTAPALPATVMATFCYSLMFDGCLALFEAPELPSVSLAEGCYYSMFSGCTSLYEAPELPATTLAGLCYSSMFYGCTALHESPVLPATTLVSQCYELMFNDCKNLEIVTALFTTAPGASYTLMWLSNTASVGTFVKNASATWNVTGTSGIPAGWYVISE